MRSAGRDKKEIIVDILSESFDTNRSVNYVVNQDSSRRQRVKRLMSYSFDVCSKFGEVWLSDDELACALVLFKDKQRFTLRSILWDIKLALTVIGINRIGPVLSRESSIKAYHPKTPFAYLWFVGVKPSSQNKRIGSNLLNELINRYKAQSRPIYLETSVERNLPWYKRHGFEEYEVLRLSYDLHLMRLGA